MQGWPCLLKSDWKNRLSLCLVFVLKDLKFRCPPYEKVNCHVYVLLLTDSCFQFYNQILNPSIVVLNPSGHQVAVFVFRLELGSKEIQIYLWPKFVGKHINSIQHRCYESFILRLECIGKLVEIMLGLCNALLLPFSNFQELYDKGEELLLHNLFDPQLWNKIYV